MKQNKKSFLVNIQIRWEKIGSGSWFDWRIVSTLLAIALQAIVRLIHS